MPLSLWTHRARLFEYHDAGSEGSVDSTYLEIENENSSDGLWWCRKLDNTGHEVTTGMQPDHRVNTVFVFPKRSPVLADGAVECGGGSYVFRSPPLPADNGHDEIWVGAERVAELRLATA